MTDEVRINRIEGDIATLFKRHDECAEERKAMLVRQAQDAGKVDLMAQSICNIRDSLVEHRQETKNANALQTKALQQLTQQVAAIHVNEAADKGAAMSRRELFGWACAVVSVLVALAALFLK